MKSTVEFGIDVLLKNTEQYKNHRIGLVCNKASVNNNGIHTRLSLQQAGLNLIKLFSPEHGFDTTGEDGAFIHNNIDPLTNLPIISLYGDKLAPSQQDLSDIDLLLIDLPDIGARFYTYLWTMTHVLDSCNAFQVPTILLDRPNPLAYKLETTEGPILQTSCASFIGRFPIPVTHHCTFGELALYFKSKYYPDLNLEIINMVNWNRTENEGYTFFPTSPAIQQRDTVYTYPGLCLFEGLNINEGRGSDYPFQQFGAPWINANELYNLVSSRLFDADVIPVQYTPTFGLYESHLCQGLRIIPHQPKIFRSFQYVIKVIAIIYELYPTQLSERNYLTNVNPNGEKHLDKLVGLENSFQKIIDKQIDTTKDKANWIKTITPYLLYN